MPGRHRAARKAIVYPAGVSSSSSAQERMTGSRYPWYLAACAATAARVVPSRVRKTRQSCALTARADTPSHAVRSIAMKQAAAA